MLKPQIERLEGISLVFYHRIWLVALYLRLKSFIGPHYYMYIPQKMWYNGTMKQDNTWKEINDLQVALEADPGNAWIKAILEAKTAAARRRSCETSAELDEMYREEHFGHEFFE